MKLVAAALILVGAAIATRALAGPFDRPFGVHSPINPEGIFALLFLVLLWGRGNAGEASESTGRKSWLPAVLIAIVVLAFCRYLAFPLIADSYVHIGYARNFTWDAFIALFTVPAGDHFFRPMGYLSYAIDGTWAGLSPTAWRASNLLFHIANTLMVYALCRRLEFPRAAAFFGALLFGIHASRPEAVTWVAARFDLLSVFFGLACLLCILRGWRTRAALVMILAAMSKESAYVVPFLAIALLRYRRRSWREITHAAAPVFLAASLVFVYRWQLLGGIGGYQDAGDGVPTVLKFRLASTLKALFPRMWGTLLFPMNWTVEPGIFLGCVFTAALVALAYMGWRSASRRPLALGFLFATICSLPVHSLLSIGPDLEKARVLYLPSIGLAIIFAAITSQRRLWLPALVFLIFQAAVLQHNLDIWKSTGYLADATCRAGADRMQRPLLVIGLPNVVDGVYFLHTGFADCVEQRTGRRPESILTDNGFRSTPDGEVLIWDSKSRKLEPR